MNEKFNFKIIFFPMVFIPISIVLITLYNIYILNLYKEDEIKRLNQEFLKRQKTITYNKVQFIEDSIALKKKEIMIDIKNELQYKVDQAFNTTEQLYIKYKNTYTQSELKDFILNAISSLSFKNKNNYFFLIDLNTNKIIFHKDKKFLNFDMTDYKDKNGVHILNEQKKLISKKDNLSFLTIYFPKPNESLGELKKLSYVKLFKPYNWIIGSGEYYDDIEKKIQASFLNEFKYMSNLNNSQIFIYKQIKTSDSRDFAQKIISNNIEFSEDILKLDDEDEKHQKYVQQMLEMLLKSSEVSGEFWSKNNSKLEKNIYFLHRYEPWNWLIGSSFNFNEVEYQVSNIIKNNNQKIKNYIINNTILSLILILLISIIFFIINKKYTKSILKYISKLTYLNHALLKEKSILKDMYANDSKEVLLLDKDGYIIECNEPFIKMLEYESKDDLIMKNFVDISNPLQKNKQNAFNCGKVYLTQCLENDAIDIDWTFLTKNNKIITTLVNIKKRELKDRILLQCTVKKA